MSLGHEYELVVVSGAQKGATAKLCLEEPKTIGNAFHCDIVLDANPGQGGDANTDEIAAYNAIELMGAKNESINIKLLSGSASANQQPLMPDTQINVEPGVAIKIATTEFFIECSEAASKNSLATLEAKGAESNSLTAQSNKVYKQNRTVRVGMLALAISLVLGGGYSYFNLSSPIQAAQISVDEQISNLLSTNAFSQLKTSLLENGDIRITGYVERRSDLQTLKLQLQSIPYTVRYDPTIGEVLAESVADVYRVHGVDAQVSAIDAKTVDILTKENRLDLLENIKNRALEDIAGLEVINAQNTPPVLEEDKAQDFTALPGKRIVMVVASEPMYILTEDGSRYFEGAILPSGHKVKSIFAQKVELTLNENVVELVF